MPDILLIDDNPTQLGIREAVLREAGISVLTAETAERALELLASLEVPGLRLIITDHVMPGVSGAEFVRALRRLSPSIPVFVISGMAEAVEEYAGLDVLFLEKPCPPEELIGQALRALEREA